MAQEPQTYAEAQRAAEASKNSNTSANTTNWSSAAKRNYYSEGGS